MKLYVTDNGTWGGTQAEMPAKCREDGSPLGGWKQADVPTDKTNLLLFLNHRKITADPTPATPKTRERPRPVATGTGRYRVNGGLRQKVFICAARADSPEDACAQVAASLVAYQPTG